jgi:hypothetical protein
LKEFSAAFFNGYSSMQQQWPRMESAKDLLNGISKSAEQKI